MIEFKHKEMIDILSSKIVNGNLPHRNTVIIGDNSVGKTTLLKTINSKIEGSMFMDLPFDKNRIGNIYESTEMVLLDNLETIFEYKEILTIMNFLESKFKDKKVVIATNNLELVAILKDFNLICLYNKFYAFCDGNDINTYDDVRLIFNRDNSIDTLLSALLNFVVCNKWTLNEDYLLNKIKNKELTRSQELMISEIEKYIL